MAIYISNALYLAASYDAPRSAPMIGWHSAIPYGEIAAGFDGDEPENAPALWGPDTYSYVESGAIDSPSPTTYYIYMANPNLISINYVGVAGHNFGDNAGNVLMQYKTQYSMDNSTWTDAISLHQQLDNRAIIMAFTPVIAPFWRIVVVVEAYEEETELKIKVAHVRAGTLLRLQRSMYVGVTPFTIDREVDLVDRDGDTGLYLGDIVKREFQNYTINQNHNDPGFVRTYILPFLDHCGLVGKISYGPQGSFFAGWRPDLYPNEVIYCHPPRQIQRPKNQLVNGMMQWSISGKAQA